MSVKFDMVSIFVTDMARMITFYRDILGLEVAWDGSSPYAEFTHDGVRFSMFERAQVPEMLGREVTYVNGLNGTFALVLDVPCYTDVDESYKRLVSSGVSAVRPPRSEPWGARSAYIADPDGNLIEIASWNQCQSEED